MKNSMGVVGGGENQKGRKALLKKNSWLWVVIGIVAAVVVVVVIFGLGIYKWGWNNSASKFVERIIPYPAATVKSESFSTFEYRRTVEAIQFFMEHQQEVDLGSEEGKAQLAEVKKQLYDKMVDDALIVGLAKDRGLEVSNSDMDDIWQELVAQSGDEETAIDQLDQNYGLTKEEFLKLIVKPQLWREKLMESYGNDESLFEEEKKRAEEVLAKVKEEGADFAKLAEEFSEGPTASQGGDLGFFARGVMVPEFEEAAFSLDVGQISDVVKTEFGYHVIKVEEKKDDEEVRARHILIKTKSFDDWIVEQRDQAGIHEFLKVE